MYTVIACTHAVYTIYTNIFLHRVEEASVAAKEAAAELIGQGLLDEQAASLQLEEQTAAMAAIAVMPAVGEVEVVAEDQQRILAAARAILSSSEAVAKLEREMAVQTKTLQRP